MATITLTGTPAQTFGDLPKQGENAPDFQFVKPDFSTVSLEDFKGKRLILNIFLSVETSVCAASVREFNSRAANMPNTEVLCISKDLPYALKRFCGTEGLDKAETVSDYRSNAFGKAYGTMMINGPLEGLHARSVVVINEEGKVVHSELVPEIVNEPNYEAALAALK
jgi:thioredoxin-dependent peroxiredoxin